MQDPKEEIQPRARTDADREGAPAAPGTNGGEGYVRFLVLQGIGEYDYVPLLAVAAMGAEVSSSRGTGVTRCGRATCIRSRSRVCCSWQGKVVLLGTSATNGSCPAAGWTRARRTQQTLVREFKEELSIDVEPQEIIDRYVFEVIPSRFVSILTYGCRLRGAFRPALSDEHNAFGLHALGELERIPLPAGYARSIRSWSAHALS